MNSLLTEEEIKKALYSHQKIERELGQQYHDNEIYGYEYDNKISSMGSYYTTVANSQNKKTLQEVVKWGDEDCPHMISYATKPKRRCDICWEVLKKMSDE
jgi:hypothetical protein